MTEGIYNSFDVIQSVAIYKSIVNCGVYSMGCTANALLTSGDCRDVGVAEIWHILYHGKYLNAIVFGKGAVSSGEPANLRNTVAHPEHIADKPMQIRSVIARRRRDSGRVNTSSVLHVKEGLMQAYKASMTCETMTATFRFVQSGWYWRRERFTMPAIRSMIPAPGN